MHSGLLGRRGLPGDGSGERDGWVWGLVEPRGEAVRVSPQVRAG